MNFLSDDLEKYISDHTGAASQLLEEIHRETYVKQVVPRMLSGHVQGRILSMVSHMVRPERILEIGTFTGYSALCMAEGLQSSGKLITLEVNEELESDLLKFFGCSPYANQIELKIGVALELLPELEGAFDLVFIDADKENYINYYEQVLPKVSQGGFILVDNVLWSGKVLDLEESQDKDTKALAEFNRAVQNDDRVENVLLGVRDGIMVLRKL